MTTYSYSGGLVTYPPEKIEKLAKRAAGFAICWAVFSAMVGLIIFLGLGAISKEVAFNEAIRIERCNTGNFPAGYCGEQQPLTIAEGAQ